MRISDWSSDVCSSDLDTRETFWEDPFVGLYLEEEYLLHRLRLKIKDTPFQPATKAVEGDHYFSYDASMGKVMLYTVAKGTEDNREAFDDAHRNLSAYDADGRKVYYEEQQTGGKVIGVAKTYLKPGRYLEIHYEYPQTDENARATIHGILQYVKVQIGRAHV